MFTVWFIYCRCPNLIWRTWWLMLATGSRVTQTGRGSWQVCTFDNTNYNIEIQGFWIHMIYNEMSVIEFCELHKAEYMEILLHVSVRWLSLERCVTRILRLYDPLASYFNSASMVPHIIFISCILVILTALFCYFIQDENQVRWRFREVFSDPTTEVYLLFLQATIPTFTSFNLLLRREQSSVFLLHDEVQCEGGICFCCCVLFSVLCFLLLSSGSLYKFHPLFYTCKCLCCRWETSFASCVQSSWCLQRCRATNSFMKLLLKKRQTICQVSVWSLTIIHYHCC